MHTLHKLTPSANGRTAGLFGTFALKKRRSFLDITEYISFGYRKQYLNDKQS